MFANAARRRHRRFLDIVSIRQQGTSKHCFDLPFAASFHRKALSGLVYVENDGIGIALWFGLIGCRRYDSNMLNKLAYHCTTSTIFEAMSNRYPSIYL